LGEKEAASGKTKQNKKATQKRGNVPTTVDFSCLDLSEKKKNEQ
jgi:hypothetical protein